MEYPDGLNSEQYNAVAANGHCMVLAGAGAGKTRTVIVRLRNILESIDPGHHVLCMSFSKKAAQEMKDRLVDMADSELLDRIHNNKQLEMGTFHAWSAKYIRSVARNNGSIEGRDARFTIADKGVQKKIVRGLMDENFTSLSGSDRFTTKDGKANPDAFIDRYLSKKDRTIEWVHGENDAESALIQGYEHTMRINNAVDFSDLINMSVRHMNNNPDERMAYAHVIVDEFQDTSSTQYRLMELVSEYATVFCVGDVDQSIYEWRSASPKNVTRFIDEFQAKLCILESNYRSTPSIVFGANALIQYNRERPDKIMTPFNKGGKPIIFAEPEHFYEESTMVAKHAKGVAQQGLTCAILYRSNMQSRLIEKDLTEMGAQYMIVKDVGFMNRREISTTMNLLKYIRNPMELQSFNMTMEHCVQGVSAKSSTSICEALRSGYQFQVGAGDTIDFEMEGRMARSNSACIEGVKLNKPAQSNLGRFLTMTCHLSELSDNDGDVSRIIDILKSDYFYDRLSKFSGDKEKEILNRQQNIDSLLGMLGRHKTLAGFLDAIALDVSNEEESDSKIQLMTIHASKGLEFDHVIIIGHTEENMCKRISTDTDYEEARRLMYVAMTRAKTQLIISAPKGVRTMTINPKTKAKTYNIIPTSPCHFASEIPPEFMPKRPSNEHHYTMLSRYNECLKHDVTTKCRMT